MTAAARSWFPKPYADFVARLRVPCGFLLLITFAFLSRPNRHSMIVGLPIACVGLVLRGWSAGHLAKNQKLTTGGPYAYLRNPLYLGTLIVALGIVIASRNRSLTIIFGAVFLLVYLPVIELEEQHLRDIFPEYASYADHVYRLLPLRHWPHSTSRFSWALYRKNEEYKAVLGFLCAAAWLFLQWKL